ALSNCLSCKGCTPECPSNVNLALLKAELLYATHRKYGLGLRERILSRPDLLGELGCAFPRLTNGMLEFGPVLALMEQTLGLSAKRTLPKYARERFDRWFDTRAEGSLDFARDDEKRVILWDDTFVRYNEPHIGKAAVKVLEALGYQTSLAQERKCCGRPAFSQGNLDLATAFADHNVRLLSSLGYSTTPILFLEPSCYSMFVDDYRELKIPNAEEVAKRCFLFEQFVNEAIDGEPSSVFRERREFVAIHAHCHAKSLVRTRFMAQLVEKIPGRRAKVLDTGCCGMAGAFGMTERKRELSLQVAAPLLEKIYAEPADATIVASGTSCRHQISELSNRRPKHMAEVLADALA
ncbi:MAG: FAD-binding oxidoreductase, partial [Chthoniobacterales bacterium]